MGTRSVLVIDDDKELREVLSRALSRGGFRVQAEEDGAAGLAAALRDGPDAVVSDVMMPGLDGLQVLKALKAARPATVFILTTGFPSAEDARRAAELGALAYLAKPYDLPAVLALLDRALPPEAPHRTNTRRTQ